MTEFFPVISEILSSSFVKQIIARRLGVGDVAFIAGTFSSEGGKLQAIID